MATDTTDGLMLAEDPDLQRKEDIAERVGWVLIAAVIIAAALGFLAGGPLAATTLTSRDGQLEVTYDRFARQGGSTDLEVRIAPEAAQDGQAQLWVTSEYLTAVEIQQAIVPEPSEWVASGDGVLLTFTTDGAGPLQAAATVRPDEIGRYEVEMALGDGPPVQFTQTFLP